MGSIGCFREKGLSDQAFFSIEYPSMKVLATARKGGVIYAAFEKPDGEVFAFVSPFSASRGEFIYKMQSEEMGPCDAQCPAKILDMLTPTDDTYSNEWRAKCRANIAKAVIDNGRSKQVVAGTKIVTAEPVFYGKHHGYFSEFVYSGKGTGFTAYRNGEPCERVYLSNWKGREYEIVAAPIHAAIIMVPVGAGA
jgi:hypothetical protein